MFVLKKNLKDNNYIRMNVCVCVNGRIHFNLNYEYVNNCIRLPLRSDLELGRFLNGYLECDLTALCVYVVSSE